MVAGLGTLVAAHGEVRFVWRGVLAMTASQFTEASKLVPSRVDMESHRVPSSAAAIAMEPRRTARLRHSMAAMECAMEPSSAAAGHQLGRLGELAL